MTVRINIKLYGDLKRHAPNADTDFPLSIDTGTTLGDVLKMLSVPEGRHVALINGRRSNPDTSFSEGDTLVLMPLISGG